MDFKKIVFSLYIIIFSLNIDAQILNIERLRLSRDTAKPFIGKVTGGFNNFNRSAAAESPVNLLGSNINANALYYPGKHAYMAISTIDYLKINDNDFLNFGFLHLRANFFREENVNYEAFFQYSYDNFRGLFPRYVAGASVRLRVYQKDNLSVIIGVGGFYEEETWQIPRTDDQVKVSFFKSSNYFSVRFSINEFLDFNTINYYQVGYDPSINGLRNRFSSISVLNSKISTRFSLTNSFEINYEDRPIVPITKLIFAFRTGISFNL
ncbi:MAG: DUF481 domain-containing protein [Luteibaculaceae bacterium]